MSRKERFKEWCEKWWKIMVIGLLVAALIVVSLAIFIPKINGLESELSSTKAELATKQDELTAVQVNITAMEVELAVAQLNLIATKAELAACQGDLADCEEALEEALPTLPTKAEVEAVLRAKFNTCRTITTDALRQAFPTLEIDLQPLTDQGEKGSCYIQVKVAEGRFFIVGTRLLPLIVVPLIVVE